MNDFWLKRLIIVLLSEVIPEFLLAKEIEQGCSINTVKAYGYDLAKFLQITGDMEIDQVKIFHLRRFLKVLYNKEYSKRSLSRKIACLKTFFDFCMENEILEKNPAVPIKSPKIRPEDALPKYLSREDMAQILKFFDKII